MRRNIYKHFSKSVFIIKRLKKKSIKLKFNWKKFRKMDKSLMWKNRKNKYNKKNENNINNWNYDCL